MHPQRHFLSVVHVPPKVLSISSLRSVPIRWIFGAAGGLCGWRAGHVVDVVERMVCSSTFRTRKLAVAEQMDLEAAAIVQLDQLDDRRDRGAKPRLKAARAA